MAIVKKIIIHTDGGARGNPGPAAIGGVIVIDNSLVPEQSRPRVAKSFSGGARTTFSKYIGKSTNNDAEYRAVIFALEKTKTLLGNEAQSAEIEVNIDSELICKQVNGEYKVKNPNLQKLFIQLYNLRQQFAKVKFQHVRREKNKEADALVNKALDENLKNIN